MSVLNTEVGKWIASWASEKNGFHNIQTFPVDLIGECNLNW